MPSLHEHRLDLPAERLLDKTRVASDAANVRIKLHSSRIALFCVLLLAGCGTKDEIQRYRVAKQENLDALHNVTRPQRPLPKPAEAVPTQTLAAMIPLDELGWFFKISGPPDVVGPHVAEFDKFVRSLSFDPAGKPSWKLPTGWTQDAGDTGSGMRFATIRLGTGRSDAGEKPLDMSVIMLPRNEQDEAAYVLANVNRWRGQLELPPLEAGDLAAETKRVDLTGAHAIVVNMEGESSGDRMGAAPFANRAGGPPRRTEAPASPPQKVSLEYKAPNGWEALPVGGMRKAAFLVQDGDQKAELTVIDLEAAAGALLPNINRWRGQLQLSPTTQADLDRELKKITVGSVEGQYIELRGPKDVKPPKAMLGVVAVHEGKAWFFKFLGDAPLVKREKHHFEEFVRSVKLPQE